jgi:deazaflavin-dependent oxidoreductase (nitroreductase family)
MRLDRTPPAGKTVPMSRLTTTLQRLGHRRWFATVSRRLVPVDRWLSRRTGGRWSPLRGTTLSYLLLTTTGRRSGEPRSQPLLYAPDGNGYVVVGSNWGQTHHPGWTANLLANPEATVTLDGKTVAVRAVLATGAERERLWAKLVALWPAYETYVERAGGRKLRLFRLEPR